MQPMFQLKLVPNLASPTYAACRLPTEWGEFEMRVLAESAPETVALIMGSVDDGTPVLTRLHSECLTGDVFSSRRCDCEAQLHASLAAIAQEGRGILIYLRQEGRGIGLYNKILAYRIQEQGADTVDANRLLGLGDDLRTYGTAKTFLDMLGIQTVRLMTNNPAKVEALEALGITVSERIGLHVGHNTHNLAYVQTKQRRMRHWED